MRCCWVKERNGGTESTCLWLLEVPAALNSYLYPAEFPELVYQLPQALEVTAELAAGKMADEALAGLDEGALRKMVSSPSITPL
jgi:hypothetical protein